MHGLLGVPNVEITHLVDPDKRTFAIPLRAIERATGRRPRTCKDFRAVLDDKEVDAVAIATPNHWHCVMSVWAAAAGKHAFVEKMFSHAIQEGRIAADAAANARQVVAHAAQRRSMSSFHGVAQFLASGEAGRVLYAKAICYRERPGIGFQTPRAAPQELDFNLWLGPGPEVPFHDNLLHYNWHFSWAFGDGEAGAQAIHQLDVARWGLGDPDHPIRVRSVGGRLGRPSQSETPDTVSTLFEFADAPPLLLEIRPQFSQAFEGWRLSPHNYGRVMGNVFVTDRGVVVDDLFFPNGGREAVPIPAANGGEADVLTHSMFDNFVGCIRGTATRLYSDAEQGHRSSVLCHLANISYRLGTPCRFDQLDSPLGGGAAGQDGWNSLREHLNDLNSVHSGTSLVLGRTLSFNPKAETFADAEANAFLLPTYRAPFALRP